MTLADLILNLRTNRDTLIRQRGVHTDALARMRASLDGPTPATAAQIDAEGAARAAIDTQIEVLTGRITELEAEQARDEAVNRLQSTPGAPAAAGAGPSQQAGRAYDDVARIGQEPRTYRADTDRGGRQFIRDVARAFYYGPSADGGASERLSRHMAEERVVRGDQLLDRAGQTDRAVGTGAFAGLTVPQYLTDMYAPAAAALRPFADACNGHTLPESGMTLNLSRITTTTGVALQASENAAVQNTDIDDTLLTIAVQTAAGQQTMSRQAIERGTGTEDVTVQDLYNQWATRIDNTLITQASTGLSAVATSVAYTDASPTAAELYPKILNAAANVEAAMLALGTPDLAVMHSRRWYWLQSQLSSSWPLIQQSTIPLQTGGVADAKSRYGDGVRGVLPSGLAVVVDNNLATNLGAGTNEDEIHVLSSNEAHLWEDPSAPMFIRAEQPSAGNLGVLLVLYSYFAYSFQRYASGMQKVNGTGLVTPVF